MVLTDIAGGDRNAHPSFPYAFFVAGIYLAFLLFFLHLSPIGSSSEAREAHVIQSMLDKGSLLLPERNGLVVSKPPLFHWTGLLISEATGLSPLFAARLISALAASVLVFGTMRFARLLFPGGGEMFPILAGAALSTNYEFIRLSLDCRVDMLFSVLVFIAYKEAYLCAGSSQSAGKSAGGSPFIFCVAAGLAVLTKGPLGLLLPLLISSSVLWFSGGWAGVMKFLRQGGVGWLLFFVLASSWYLFAAFSGADSLLSRQLVFENLERFFGGDLVNVQPIWYYFEKGLRGSFPWFIIFLLAIPSQIKRLAEAKRTGGFEGRESAKALLFVGLLAGLLFLSLASGKRYSYLAPLFPVLSVYAANILKGWLDRTGIEFKRLLPAFAIGSVQALVFLIVLAGAVSLDWSFPLKPAMFVKDFLTQQFALFATIAFLMLAILYFARLSYRAGTRMSVLLCYAAIEYFILMLIFSGVGSRNALCNFEDTARGIRKIVNDEELQIVRDLHDEYFDPVLYYLRKHVKIIPASMYVPPCKGYLLAKREWYEGRIRETGRLLREVAIFSRIPDSWKGGDRKDMFLFKCEGDT